MTKPDTPVESRWHGQTVYGCRLCAFSTLHKAAFEDHFAKVHAPMQVVEGRKAEVAGLHAKTVAELKEEAERIGLELEPSVRKADIIAAIEAAPKEGE